MNDEIIEISDGEDEISAKYCGKESNLLFPEKHTDYVVLEWPKPAVKGYRQLTIHNADGQRLRPERGFLQRLSNRFWYHSFFFGSIGRYS
jgi:hypothetical protein